MVVDPNRVIPGLDKSIGGRDASTYSVKRKDSAYIFSVNFSGAELPVAMLYFMPKSPSGPPGLWLADKIIPPKASWRRITHDAAGVERIPF